MRILSFALWIDYYRHKLSLDIVDAKVYVSEAAAKLDYVCLDI